MSYKQINIIAIEINKGLTRMEIAENMPFQRIVFDKVHDKSIALKIDGKAINEITCIKFIKNKLIIYINAELSFKTGICQYTS